MNKSSLYSNWVSENVTEQYGKCAEVTEKMQKSFPELERVRGHYYCYVWGERQHWWLVDRDNNIIDPTMEQFPSKGRGRYEPWNEGAPEPTGKCPNCGELIYSGDFVCGDICGREYVSFCSKGI